MHRAVHSTGLWKGEWLEESRGAEEGREKGSGYRKKEKDTGLEVQKEGKEKDWRYREKERRRAGSTGRKKREGLVVRKKERRRAGGT